jgi:methyl-accepting chemotaxis protein
MAEKNPTSPSARRKPTATKAPAKTSDSESSKNSMFDAFSRSMAMIEFTVDGTIIWANDNFLQTIGYSIDEIKGRHHSLFVDPEYRNSKEYRDFWYELGQGIAKVARFKRFGKGGGKSICKRPTVQSPTITGRQ